jgi:hypothetical protein
MKKYLINLLLLLLPTVTLAQSTSWFEIELEFGGFTSSNTQGIVITQGTDTLYEAYCSPSNQARYRYAVINADTGDINVELKSAYSYGWYSYYFQSDSYLNIRNYTQGEVLDLVKLDFSNNNIDWVGVNPNWSYDTVVNLLSQPPPVVGCMDSTSSSYNTAANINNGQCKYPVTFAVDMNSYPDTFSQVYVSGQFNSWSGIADSLSDSDSDGVWTGTIDILNNPGWLWKYSVDNWADQELPPNIIGGGNPYATCFLLDAAGFTNRNLIVNGDSVILDTNCWETCLDCADIIGCTDSTSNEFNPWATVSDGLCIGNPLASLNCSSNQTYIDVQFTPDTYGAESSWIVYGDSGAVYTASQGTFSGKPQGVPISHYICVDTNVLIDIVLNDSYGDGLNGTLYGGSVDGDLKVYDCSGNLLWALSDTIPSGNFGYQFTSPQFSTGGICSSGGSDVYGCMNPFSTTYNPNATIDTGSCGTPRIVGCIDTSAFNYIDTANTSEIMTGNYTLKIYDGAANGWGGTWLGIKQGSNLSPQYKMGPNDGYNQTFDVPLNIYEPIDLYLFTTTQSQNSIAQVAYTLYGPEGDTIVDVPYWGATTLQFPIIQRVDSQPTFGDVCIEKVFGCIDTSSLNYDSLANTDDGSCIPIIIGCMNDQSFNYDSTANVSGPCIDKVVGCMDSTSFNFNPLANTPGACIPIIIGCMDSSSFNFNPLANTPDTCIAKVFGCIDPTSFNYDSTANVDDGSCIARIYGCMDSTSLNFNPLANTDNGNCIPKVFGCMNPQSFNFNPLANVNDGSCIARIYGCMDSTSFNYNPLANTDNGTCIPKVYGCTDPSAFNYNPLANTENFTCVPKVYGCTDSTSINYDPLANVDNGSCIAAIYGCTDPNAYNYNPNANVSDTTACLYDAGCIDGPGNPYWLNDPCYAWVIDVDEYCCTNSWDPDCQSLYNYCATVNGTLSIDDIDFKNIVVYPNPTTNTLNIKTTLDITYTLYDFTGKLIVENSKERTIDMSSLANGVYFLSIEHHGTRFNKKIVKED